LRSFKKMSRHRVILIIYDAMFFFFVFKMFFYMTYVGRFPDELQHISYIAYLQQEKVIIPEFKDMRVLQKTSDESNQNAFIKKTGYSGTYKFGKSFNYLGHPPLYYHIMRLSGGVKVAKDGKITINIIKLRTFNIFLAAIAMIIMFYIGYTRLGNLPPIHLLYATVCVSIPMLSYGCAGVNNDTLTLLGITLFLLGLLRMSEYERGAGTFALIGAGIAVTLLSKMVAGLVIAVSIVLFLTFTLISEKNLRFLFSKAVLAAIPPCLIAFIYFIIVYKQTGTFQPTFRILAPEQFYASNFYVKPARRRNYNFAQYSQYYWNSFMHTWTGIYSYVKFLKPGNFYTLAQIGLVTIWALPVLLFIQVRKKFHYPMAKGILAMYIGLIFTACFQFLRAYHEFKDISGYLGGFQSRYYLCMIPMLALAAVYAFGFLYDSKIALFRSNPDGSEIVLSERKWQIRRKAVVIFCIAFTALLLYEDFIYFIINFSDYL
jgi:4-amino-4-deoxy-L-arabinose transferase-like glycosyltransferase